MDVWWFPIISYVKIWFIIQLKQPFTIDCLGFQGCTFLSRLLLSHWIVLVSFHQSSPILIDSCFTKKNNTIPPKKNKHPACWWLQPSWKNSPKMGIFPQGSGWKWKTKNWVATGPALFGLSGFQRAVSWHHGSSSSINSQVRQLIQGPFNLGDVTDEFHRKKPSGVRWSRIIHSVLELKTAASSKTV